MESQGNTFASTRRFRSFKGRLRDETSRRSFQWKYIYSCTSCKVATSFSSLISTRVQREAGHTLTRNVNNVSSNGCLPRSILTTFAVPRRSFGREDFCKRTSVYRNSRVSRGSKKKLVYSWNSGTGVGFRSSFEISRNVRVDFLKEKVKGLCKFYFREVFRISFFLLLIRNYCWVEITTRRASLVERSVRNFNYFIL